MEKPDSESKGVGLKKITDTERILEQLHEHEKEVLKALQALKKAKTEEISEKTGLSKDGVEKAVLWAKLKELTSEEEEITEYLQLTDEGREYVENGLPEKNLIGLVSSGINKISGLKEKYERADIGIIWAKKYGWVTIKNGVLDLTEKGKEAMKGDVRGEQLIRSLTAGRLITKELAADKSMIEDFVKRGLIKKVEEKERRIYLTNFGKDVAKSMPKKIVKTVGQLTPDMIRSGEWKKMEMRKYGINLPSPRLQLGKVQPYRQLIDEVREKLIGLGFVEARGPLVELGFWNCDSLFMPQDHPARGIHDIFFVKEPRHGKVLEKGLWERVKATHENGWITGSKGWGGRFSFDIARRLLLRSQTTAVSARSLAKLKNEDLPVKVFTIDRNFRPDIIDSKHFIEFHQCEGIVAAKGLNFRNLLGYLKEIATALGFEKVRFKPGFFPFTEPSVEGFVLIPEMGWMETLCAGIFRPEVTMPLGIDVPVLAWGLGIDRLAMKKLGVSDIRMIFADDLGWLRNKPLIR